MRALPWKAQLYTAIVWVLGITAIAAAFVWPAPASQGPAWEIAVFAGLAVAAGGLKVNLLGHRTPDNEAGTITLGFALIYVTLIRFGPAAGIVVALVSCATSCLYPKPQPLYQLSFNMALAAVAAWCAGVAFLLLNGGTLALHTTVALLAVALSSLTYYVVNAAGVGFVVALATGQPLSAQLLQGLLWSAPTYLAGACATALTSFVTGGNLASILLFGVPIAYLVYQSYRMHVELAGIRQQRIDELQANEARLAALFSRAEARTAQQKALTELGFSALHAEAIDNWLMACVRAVAATLGAQRCGMLEVGENGREAVLRAGVGWAAGAPATVRLGAPPWTRAAGAQDWPLVLTSPSSGSAFGLDLLLQDGSPGPVVTAVIHNGLGRNWGLLFCAVPAAHRITPDDLDFVRGVASLVGLVLVRHDSASRLLANAEEIRGLNERLQRAMTETHHRVKNNLQIVTALIDMQVTSGSSVVPMGELVRVGNQVRALATLHDMLTEESRGAGDVAYLSIAAAMERLVPIVQGSVGAQEIDIKVDDVLLPARQATAIAVLVHELVSNAAKHGNGRIELTFAVDGEHGRLSVSDGGPGFPPGFDLRAHAHTGLELVERMGRWDLQGDVTLANRPEGGACVSIVFPVEPTAGVHAVTTVRESRARTA